MGSIFSLFFSNTTTSQVSLCDLDLNWELDSENSGLVNGDVELFVLALEEEVEEDENEDHGM